MLKKIITKIVAALKAKIATAKTKNKKVMKKYTINDFVFTPDEHHQIRFDGKAVHLSPLQSKMLIYLAENPYRTLSKADILQNVWESQEPPYEAITRTLSELRDKLPKSTPVTSARGIGYAFEHEVVVEQVKFERLERLIAHSPAVKSFLYTLVFIAGLAAITNAGYGVASLYYKANPPPRYELINVDPQFTRNNTIGAPQLSPDGRFVAHLMSNDLFVNDKLGLLDLEQRDTRPLVPMSFTGGYKWNLTGDKIVYQHEGTGKCEVRLLTFHDEDKIGFSDERLSFCDQNSGSLNFAWFSDSEFYTNFVADGAAPRANNMPLHHLYRFNINTKEKYLVKRTDDTGGLGFYSLAYDPTTELLYFLQTDHFKSTTIYQYDGKTIKKVHSLDYYLRFFTVSNNKLVYKNSKDNFVISDLSNNNSIDEPQTLLRPRLAPLSEPDLQGDKLVYLAGNVYKTTVYELANNQLTTINTDGFNPIILASYNNQLVFTAKETNVTQIYLLTANNKVKKLSNMQENQSIYHLEIAGDVFVVSYAQKVVIYRLKDNQLALIKEVVGYNRGIIDASGEHLLLSNSKDNEVTNITEKRLSDLKPTGRKLTGAKLAFYHQGDIVYLDKAKELFRITKSGPKTIANNIAAVMFKHISVIDDELYYLEWYTPKRPVFKLNLTTGIKEPVLLESIKPILIQAANNNLYIGATSGVQATLVVGDVVMYE